VFEIAAPIQSPAKCEVSSLTRFLNTKGEGPAEIHQQIVAVYGNVMNRQNVTKWCREFSEGRTDVHDEQRSGRPFFISDEFLQEIEGEIRANRRVTIRELHHIIPEVSKTTIHEAVTEKITVQKIVRKLGAQNVNGRSQNETDGFRAEVSHALRTGMR
jgi:transposase